MAAAAVLPRRMAAASRHPKTTSFHLSTRAREVLRIRAEAANRAVALGFPDHTHNGDQTRHDPRWVCYSKGLPHTPNGEADAAAVRALAAAIDARDARALEAVPLGGYMKLANPEAAFAYDLIGPDSHQLSTALPPACDSAEQAAEAVELYWKALARDVPFDEYEMSPIIAAAAKELSALGGFRGPRINGRVTPASVFRGGIAGGMVGPYVSQFLWRDLPWTPIRIPQLIRVAAPQTDYLTDEASWLAIQNGGVFPVNDYHTTPRYVRTGRDLAELVHRDFTYQEFLGAALMLFRMSAPIDGGMAYQHSLTQSGFVTFGPSDILHIVAIVANIALKAAWYQKWVVHRRLRPEEFGARVHFHSRGVARYPLHADVLNSTVVDRVGKLYGAKLLPQSYPEGAPLHPSYPAGHAVVAGACATALKACFAESYVIPDPVVPSNDGLHLVPYRGAELTVGNELDKLAENVAFSRNFAGIHWRSDGTDGIRFGEAVAIEILREMKLTANKTFGGYSLTKFDGRRIVIE